MSAALPLTSLAVLYGRERSHATASAAGLVFHSAVRSLGALQEETLTICGNPQVETVPLGVFCRTEHQLLGALHLQTARDRVQPDTRELYGTLLAALRGMVLYRVWNYVPQINYVEDGLENYHRFNLGRWQAFSDVLGHGFESQLPAASAVGGADGELALVFIAGRAPAHFVENPLQMPAWQYPAEYGPRSPSFSRGAGVASPRQQRFISGTASIRGHQTVATGDLAAQCRITVENMVAVAEQLGAPGLLQCAQTPWQGKIYIRHPEHALQVLQNLRDLGYGLLAERCVVLHAPICRACLDVEIEVTQG